MISDINEQQCTYHPNVRTRLRCSKCGTPICPRCAVETPVGYRCPNCAGVRGLPSFRTGTGTLLKSVAAGLLVAVAVGVLWGFIPDWNFYLCLALGFGVAESMAWTAKYKRGRDLQIAGVVLVVVGLVISRVMIAQRNPLVTIDDLLNNSTNRFVADIFYLRLIPDMLFAILAAVIPFVRFR